MPVDHGGSGDAIAPDNDAMVDGHSSVGSVYKRVVHPSLCWHLHDRYASAQHDHLTVRKLYDEGRVTALKYFEKSESLMTAELALAGENDRSGIVSRHVARIIQVMKQEENDSIGCRGVACLAEAREYHARWSKRSSSVWSLRSKAVIL